MALRPSGFVEYSPSEQRIFDQLITEIQNQFRPRRRRLLDQRRATDRIL